MTYKQIENIEENVLFYQNIFIMFLFVKLHTTSSLLLNVRSQWNLCPVALWMIYYTPRKQSLGGI